MTPAFRRLTFWAIPALALAGGLAAAFWPRPVETDLARVERGPLISSVAEQGKTRIADVFVVSAPVGGRVLRVTIEPGDSVVANETVVAEIEPRDPEFLDVRSEAEARAAVAAARAAFAHAQALLEQARAELDFATAEVARVRNLRATNTVSERALEDAERSFRTRQAAVSTAEAAVEMRRFELEAAEVRLLRPEEAQERAGSCPCIPIRAPVDGQVLRVLHESEGVVAAGTPLLEIGDPQALEFVVEFLSTDAVRIRPGQRAIIEDWGGAESLNGVVERIEPFGFTKVSALGIEEQRVNVIVDLTDPLEKRARLGHGFEAEVRVVLGEAESALKVPLTALFRDRDMWAVFEVVEGRARLRTVEIGERTDTEASIIEGLEEGARVVRFPDDRILDGLRIRTR
ncbi:HlyD family efflux transporter periplasmic adaptor subunit [Limibaculum sp. FT325]|uniref:efflux RND transporter periplasmic adaptor subunit n=1 Tax=Thermohalobaculum sediminis TaxID=2939436 RepID=UPI0020C12925|nr:HlyD family efflux transporter periplasmic adaptor subunit [Limibaculum sediminis]MCL5778697.1 HlyD family efflux transporter periplasmic adaptor subunit [Limibaculum sediminis]